MQISFILAEKDTNTEIFRGKFEKPYLLSNLSAAKLCDVVVIKNANHIYALEESQHMLLDYIMNTLNEGNLSDGKKSQ